MCGIVGYVGPQQAQNVVIDGLRRLEYRGYDSAGIAIVSDRAIQTRKKAGKLANLEAELVESPISPSHTGIGHTRWATHGAPNDVNAHPHVSEDGSIAVIHNGIIENFAMLRDKLIAEGVTLRSQTDTEVVAHLLSKQMKSTPGLVLSDSAGPSGALARSGCSGTYLLTSTGHDGAPTWKQVKGEALWLHWVTHLDRWQVLELNLTSRHVLSSPPCTKTYT